MKTKSIILLIAIFFLASVNLSAKSTALEVVEKYDQILARLDAKKIREKNYDLEEIDQAQNKKQTREPYKISTITFDHDKFPNLEGTWLVSRTTVKRLNQPYITEPSAFIHCNSVIPFEIRDFKDKEVIISARGPDFFVVNAKHPLTQDVYNDPDRKQELTYFNFGFKAVIDPRDLTYAYTPKLDNYMANFPRSRQLWLNGKLQYRAIGPGRIVARGYEVEYSPKCTGFLLDEVEFVFNKYKDGDFEPKKPRKLPFLEQPAYAEPEEIISERKSMPPLDSAKDRSGFQASNEYKLLDTTELRPAPKGTNVPGMW